MKKIQYKAASIIWKSDVIPFSNQFQDPYFSVDGGLAESQYVFIKGNDLYDRLIDGFKIAELVESQRKFPDAKFFIGSGKLEELLHKL